MQDYNWPSTKVIAIGKSGSGKTTLIWKLVMARKDARFIFIYDHKAMEFSRRYNVKPCFTKQDMQAAIQRGDRLICFVPSQLFPGDVENGFEVFCTFVFGVSEHIAGVKLLLVDELQNVVGSYSRPKPLLIVCDTGRTFQIDCYFIASASNAIHNLVKKQMTEVYCFNNKGNIEWETDVCGFNETAIRNLVNGLWLHRNVDIGSEVVNGGIVLPDKRK